MKTLIQHGLKRVAQKIIAKQKPKIVAITGSVGKTSTRNAIAALLGEHFVVRTNIKNYNNEFGVPLTIIGVASPGRSVFGWLKVFAKAWRLAFVCDSTYPNLLVLEYGADKPGDIRYLCEIAQPDIAVLTAISPVHLANFGSMEKLMNEKGSLLISVKEGGVMVVNADDPQVMILAACAHVSGKTFGLSASADVRVTNVRLETREDFSFEPGEIFSTLKFDVEAGEEKEEVFLHNRLGKGPVASVLAAVSVGLSLGLHLLDMKSLVSKIPSEPGRMHPIPGIKGSLILDDSYNAAPASMRAALEVLKQFSVTESARRIAVLGTMAELGPLTQDEHRLLGLSVAEGEVNLLVCVGEPAQDIRLGALEAGMPEEHIQFFPTSKEAGRWLDHEVRKGDIVLVKGSQSARMEWVVKDVMAEPLQAKELLVRQEDKWLA
jgi:UDP-N-acetylmuramyl pentapeptide synthase